MNQSSNKKWIVLASLVALSTVFAFGTVAAPESVPAPQAVSLVPEGEAACQGTPLLESTLSFEVLDAGTLRFKEGVEWEIVGEGETATLQYRSVDAAPGDELIALDCSCPSGCFGQCFEYPHPDDPQLAICAGSCERHGDDCDPCKWR